MNNLEGAADTSFGVSSLGTIFLWITDVQQWATLVATGITILCGVLAAVLYVLKIIEKRKELKAKP